MKIVKICVWKKGMNKAMSNEHVQYMYVCAMHKFCMLLKLEKKKTYKILQLAMASTLNFIMAQFFLCVVMFMQ